MEKAEEKEKTLHGRERIGKEKKKWGDEKKGLGWPIDCDSSAREDGNSSQDREKIQPTKKKEKEAEAAHSS